VIFSADPIPGNVDDTHVVIDNLIKLGAKVAYSDILQDLHVSGHAAANELMLLISLLRPKYVMPISGTYRQMRAYAQLAKQMGYLDQNIIQADSGQIIEINNDRVNISGKVELRNVMVDGLGVGDIGSVVLRDRQVIAADGFVVIIVPVDQTSGKVSGSIDIVSRGFVYMNKSSKLIDKAKEMVTNSLNENASRITDWNFIRRHVEDKLEKFLYNETKRRPMILPVVIEV
jgi:ribonuclease J